MKAPQILQKIIPEKIQAPQILHIVRRKMQIPHIFYDLFQPRGDREASVTGILPVEGVEDHHLIRGIFEVSLHHGQLIQICK